jgi:metal-responsive CopG/Arc/MetJ family transcriptional regulator
MKTSTVNISFNDELLKRIDQIAKQESRSRSELIREAARSYIERKNRWDKIYAFSERQARKMQVSDKDISDEITMYRKEKTRTKQ